MKRVASNKTDKRYKAVKRVKRIAIYLTKTEYFFVQESAKKAGLDFSSYIRGMTLEGHVKARMNEEERGWFRELVGMSNDLHQFVKMGREQGLLTVMLLFGAFRSRMDELLKKFRL